jgi:hypothetical protein
MRLEVLMSKESTTIFVFGSNRQGRHGAGAAKYAMEYCGAVYGQASGRQGNSYAIVTKELRRLFPPVTLSEVKYGVLAFLGYAKANPSLTFEVTKIGCGLAGFEEVDIAPMFKDAPLNCNLPEGWR